MTLIRTLGAPLAVGVVIACIATLLTGYLAALPIPAAYLDPLRTHVGLSTLLTSLLVQIPLAIAAGVVSWLMFRVLGRSTPAMLVACVAPWLLVVLIGWLSDLESLSASARNPYVMLAAVTGTLCVPLGVWLAARLSRGRRAL